MSKCWKGSLNAIQAAREFSLIRSTVICALLFSFAATLRAQSSSGPKLPPLSTPITFTAVLRERTNATQWFAATPDSEVYGHEDSLLRLSMQQRIRRFDYQLEVGQSSELFLPRDAVSPAAAQGQLGLGGTYYAASNNNQYPAAGSLRAGFLRYHFKRDTDALRLGRFEFFDGQKPPLETPRCFGCRRIALHRDWWETSASQTASDPLTVPMSRQTVLTGT